MKDEVRLTHLDKVLWPDEKITKGELIDYYQSVSQWILPHLIDRPESLNRHPHGIKAASFYQKDMMGYFPKWLKTERVLSQSTGRSINYVLCQDKRSLLYIVNLGCIEINPWFSRIGNLDRPDFIVIDLDPDGNPFSQVMELALEFHELLNEIGARSYCKTSGATGIHIGIPVGADYEYEEVRDFAEKVCRVIVKRYPQMTSVERSPARRKKKIYLDYMQNRRAQTLAVAYCVRPKPGAPVSMPLAWKELKSGLSPLSFHMKNVLQKLRHRQDHWAPVLGPGVDLKLCLSKLDQKFFKA